MTTSSKKYRQLHKFGGSSLADSECYHRVSKIIIEHTKPNDIIVVSASGKTTNQLINWIAYIKEKNYLLAKHLLNEINNYQRSLIRNLINEEKREFLFTQLEKDINTINFFSQSVTKKLSQFDIISYGEIWTARLISFFLNQKNIPSCWLDARLFLISDNSSYPKIDEKESLCLIKKFITNNINKIVIITGFISKNKNDETILLGRNGSDYSATQIGYLSNVNSITIWSDVSGIYSADPKKVKKTLLVPLLTLNEANELARLSAPVLHTRTLQPIINTSINLKLKCTFYPKKKFTKIKNILEKNFSGAKTLTYHENIHLIDIYTKNKLEFNKLIFFINKFLKDLKIYPLAVSIDKNKKIIKLAYTKELIDYCLNKLVNNKILNDIVFINQRKGFSLLGMVGQSVSRNKIHNIKFFYHIKNMQIEFLYKSQKENSVLAIIHKEINNFTIEKIHKSIFYNKKQIGIVLFGKGKIGSRWLELFYIEYHKLIKKTNCNFILAGIVTSKKKLLKYEGLDIKNIFCIFEKQAINKNQKYLFKWMSDHPYDQLIVLDITDSKILANKYLCFAKKKFHVISANKLAAGSFNTNDFNKIKKEFNNKNCYWLYNATVGAGLPINHVIRDLRNSGDTISSIKGVFSGTLSWLFVNFNNKLKFTDLLKNAWEQGLTEPDPRTDLSGKDVMRKLVILIRESGYDIEPENIKIQSLIPKEQKKISLEKFLEQNSLLDYYMFKKINKANKLNLTLRYIAEFDIKKNIARVGLKLLKRSNPLSLITPCDNIFSIQSTWYQSNPLIIRGPGAGLDVTAGAIQSDINFLTQLIN